MILAALVSVFLKEILYRKTCVVAKLTNCSALYANAWHHRSDAFSSIAVLIGLIAQMAGFEHGDQMAAVVVGGLIIAAGFDTHAADPIGGFKLQTEDYFKIARQFQELEIPTLVCQEGGYNTDVLGECAKNFLLGLM